VPLATPAKKILGVFPLEMVHAVAYLYYCMLSYGGVKIEVVGLTLGGMA